MPPDLDTTWFDEDGELTELDTSDEEVDEPAPPPPPRKPIPAPAAAAPRAKVTRASTQTATATSKQRRAQKSAVPCLKPPRTTNYSASSLFEWIQQELVDLNPEYQRGVVWNDAKQVALIGSLFSNYYVPPIVFTVKRKDDGSEIRVCIDGKQRLTSIHRFMLGEIANKDASTNRKSYFTNLPGTKYKLIAEPLRNVFKNKQITCVEYEDLTAEQEREIFQRVQLGVCLAPADRLPAINGGHADIVRSLRRQLGNTDGFKLYLDWGAARGKDFQALAQIVYLIAHGHEAGKAEPTPARIEAFLGAPIRDPAAVNTLDESASEALKVYCRILQHAELGAVMRARLHPLEFVMAAYLISRHRARLSDDQLADAMARMRGAHASLAAAGKGSRSATRIFKTLLAFVLNEVHAAPAKERGRTAAPKGRAAAGGVVENSGRAVPKRKRAPSEHSDSDVYTAPPSTKHRASRMKTEASTQKVEAGRTPPLGGQTAKPESLLQAKMPSGSSSACTSVKRRGNAPAPKKTEALQAARPSVVPQPSARTSAPARKPSQTAAGPSRPPLPGRGPSASVMSPTPPTAPVSESIPAPRTAGTAGPEANSNNAPVDPPCTQGGRLAPLRTVKAIIGEGASRSVSGPSASTSKLVAQPSNAEVCSGPGAPPVRRPSGQLPKFTKNIPQAPQDRETHPLPQKPHYPLPQPTGAEAPEADWRAGLWHLSDFIGSPAQAAQTGLPPSRRASLATPTVSPRVPQFALHRHGQVQEPPTKDPRLVKRGELEAQAAAAGREDELRQGKQPNHHHHQQRHQQQPHSPNVPTQPWQGNTAAQEWSC